MVIPVGVMTSPQVKAAGSVRRGRPPKVSISETLQGFLGDTVSRRIHWGRQQNRVGDLLVEDTFTASRDGINLELKANRPAADGDGIPSRLVNWVARLSTKGKKDRVLDGPSMILPDAVSETGNFSEMTLPKLFRAAYDAVAVAVSGHVPVIRQLTDKLRDRQIEANYSFIRPSLANPAFGSASILQVGDGGTRVEIAKFGGARQITLRENGETTKLNRPALENPELFGALNELVAEANLQRTGKPGLGLDKF